MRRLIKKLHTPSLEAWKFRNGILHGATLEQRRALEWGKITDEVKQLYEKYYSGQLLLLARDMYLFTKKPLSHRLEGDVDTLLRWIRIVEIAVRSYESEQSVQQRNADCFFRSFRELGRKKLQESLQVNSPSDRIDLSVEGALTGKSLLNHSWREKDQLSAEVSYHTQQLQRTSISIPPLEGLADTILHDTLSSTTVVQESSLSDSMVRQTTSVIF